MVRKVIVSLVLIGGSLGLSVAFVSYLIAHKPTPQRTSGSVRAPLVDTLELTPRDIREVIHGFGTARAARSATITAEVSASVVELVGGLDEGVSVKAGDVLVRLDSRQYEQDLLEAESQLMAVKAQRAQLSVERDNLGALREIADADLTVTGDELARVRRLHEDGVAPKTELDSVRLQYQAALRAKQEVDNQYALLEPRRLGLNAEEAGAMARAERAKLNTEKCAIVAPFSGEVLTVHVNVGDRVQLGSRVLGLVDLRHIEVPLLLPVSVRSRVSVGAEVSVYVESFAACQWKGQISRLSPAADERTRTFEVYVEIDNEARQVPLMPGSFVKADIAGPLMREILVVPRTTVVNDVVYVVEGDVALSRRVSIDRFLVDDAVIHGDVSAGDVVVVSNLDLLYDGIAVRRSDVDGSSQRDVADGRGNK